MSIDPVSLTPSAKGLLDLTIAQYKDSEKFRKLITILAQRHDVIDDVLLSLNSSFILEDAVGEQLDFIGWLFLCDRKGLGDDDYRQQIRTKASIRSFATPEDIIMVIRGLWGATWVEYIPEYPAACAVISDAEELTQEQLEAISPAGVRVRSGAFIIDYDGNNIADYDGNLLYGVS